MRREAAAGGVVARRRRSRARAARGMQTLIAPPPPAPAMALVQALPYRLQRRPTMPREQRLAMIAMKARPEMLPPLARFVKYLASKGLVEFGPPLESGRKGLVVVDRVQQCAFLALYFGLDMGFEFGSYSNGPVSDEMADGVYRLSLEDKAVYEAAEASLPAMPGPFREEEFLDLVSGRNPVWLCAAATMLLLNIDYRKDLDWIKDGTAGILKYTLGALEVIDDVFDDIKRRGMFRLD